MPLKADLTRSTFDPARHYAKVIMQQGRVQMDADWNEQIDILEGLDRAARADVIGPLGASGDSFLIRVGADGGLEVAAGRIYVEGIVVESGRDHPLARQPFVPRWLE